MPWQVLVRALFIAAVAWAAALTRPFHPGLAPPPAAVVVSKGMDPEQDAYSAFQAEDPSGRTFPTILVDRGIRRLYVSGLATFAVSTTLGEVQLFTQPTGLASNCRTGAHWLSSVAWVRGPRQELQGGLLSLTGTF